jgi:hypothetical protein
MYWKYRVNLQQNIAETKDFTDIDHVGNQNKDQGCYAVVFCRHLVPETVSCIRSLKAQ